EALAELPPRRAPGDSTTSLAATEEPRRLDGEILGDSGAASQGSRIEVVSVPTAVAAASRAAAGAATDPAAADLAARDQPAYGKSPIRWAYELEVGEVRP